jgi:hypothetical protein
MTPRCLRSVNNVLRHDALGVQPGKELCGGGFGFRIGTEFFQRKRDCFRLEFAHGFHLLGWRVHATRFRRNLKNQPVANPIADGAYRRAIAVGIERMFSVFVPDMQMQHGHRRPALLA